MLLPIVSELPLNFNHFLQAIEDSGSYLCFISCAGALQPPLSLDVAEGDDIVVVTSPPYRNPDSFKSARFLRLLILSPYFFSN